MLWRFADFEFSAERGLSRAGLAMPLQPKARGLLHLLLRADGAVVSKEAIAAALWPAGAPSDDSLTRATLTLRKALASPGGDCVRTVYGQGLRLACAVETVGAADDRGQAVAASLLRSAWEIAGPRTPAAIERTIDALRFAVDRFPDFAPAWSLMADAVAAQAIAGERAAGEAAAEIARHCERALGADPMSAGPLATSGWAIAALADRREPGLRRIEDALRRRPEWLAFTYRAWVRADARDLEGALSDIEAALSLSPLERGPLGLRSWFAFCRGAFDEADALARKALSLRDNLEMALLVRSGVACEKGDPVRGAALAERAAAGSPTSRPALGQLAYAHAKAGNAERARKIIAALTARPNGHASSFLVAPFVALGDLAEANRLQRKSEEENSPWRAFAWCDPRLEPLRRARSPVAVRASGPRPPWARTPKLGSPRRRARRAPSAP